MRPLTSLRTALVVLLATAASACAVTATRTEAPRQDTQDAQIPTVAAPVTAGYSLYELPSTWRDQHGDTLQLSALAGQVRVVAMVYTSCRATCPLILADLKRIEAAVPADRRADVGFVLVSLDPWRDTPGRLAEWAKQAGLDPARWTLLVGDDDAVRELAASLETRYQKQPDGEIAHTNGLTVLDRTGSMTHRQVGLGDTDATIDVVRALLR